MNHNTNLPAACAELRHTVRNYEDAMQLALDVLERYDDEPSDYALFFSRRPAELLACLIRGAAAIQNGNAELVSEWLSGLTSVRDNWTIAQIRYALERDNDAQTAGELERAWAWHTKHAGTGEPEAFLGFSVRFVQACIEETR